MFAPSTFYDPVRDRLVVCGGSLAANDVWTLSLGGRMEWARITPPGEMRRFWSSAIYDPVRNRVVVFGGQFSDMLNDVWALSLVGSPEWTQLIPAGTPPGVRYGHSAIYDPVRDRMIVFGGYGNALNGSTWLQNDVWALSLAGTPTWTRLLPTGTPPSGRDFQTATYDPVRDRMIVVGGWDSGDFYSNPRNDVWALSLSGSPEWTQLNPAGPLPDGRQHHATTYDPVRDRLIVCDGQSYGGYPLDDTWELTLAGSPAWSRLTPSGASPSARYNPGSAYDPVRDRMLVMGGVDGNDFNDVWALSLGSPMEWTRPEVAAGGWSAPSAIYDPVRTQMVVFGGRDASDYHADVTDVWAYSLTNLWTWAQLFPTGTPPSARAGHSAIYDARRQRMLVFGGRGADLLNEVWELSLAGDPAWTQLAPAGTPPSAREFHTAVYDSLRDRMVVFGGFDGGLRNDVWALSLAGGSEWSELSPSGTPPSARESHTAIYDPVRDRMVVSSGHSEAGDEDDVWALSLAGDPMWIRLSPVGTPPSARHGHTAVYDRLRDRMVQFGGFDGAYLDDLWALSFVNGPMWIRLGTPPLPSERAYHAAISDPWRNKMVVVGGYDGTYLGDAWELQFPDSFSVPVAALLSFVSADADEHEVRLKWFAPHAVTATAYRQAPGMDWLAVASVSSDGTGQISLDDRAVEPGVRYGYRLGVLGKNGEQFFGEAWITVPQHPSLSMDAVRPDPADRELDVSFSLPSAQPVTLELVDVSGRSVERRSVDATPGNHTVTLADGLTLAPGLYVVRLTQGGRSVTRKACVIH